MTSSWNQARHLNNEGVDLLKNWQFKQATEKLTHALQAVKQVISMDVDHGSQSVGKFVESNTYQWSLVGTIETNAIIISMDDESHLSAAMATILYNLGVAQSGSRATGLRLLRLADATVIPETHKALEIAILRQIIGILLEEHMTEQASGYLLRLSRLDDSWVDLYSGFEENRVARAA